jgi:hypothetical protein
MRGQRARSTKIQRRDMPWEGITCMLASQACGCPKPSARVSARPCMLRLSIQYAPAG